MAFIGLSSAPICVVHDYTLTVVGRLEFGDARFKRPGLSARKREDDKSNKMEAVLQMTVLQVTAPLAAGARRLSDAIERYEPGPQSWYNNRLYCALTA